MSSSLPPLASASTDSGVCSRFLASEIRASTAFGCMAVSCRRSSRIADFTVASWSEESQIVKRRASPSTWPCSRSALAQNAWKVPTVTPFAASPASASSRSRISPAALFVNVTARIAAASTPRDSR